MLKAFSELYIGQNPRILAQDYYKRKNKTLFLISLVAIVILILSGVQDYGRSILKNNIITRNSLQEGKEDIFLQMKTEEGTWKELEFILYPKEYTESELEILFEDAEKILEEKIKNENESLERVQTDLDLVEELDSYPFTIIWDVNPQGMIDESGRLIKKKEKIDETIELTAIFQYEDWKKEKKLSVRVIMEERLDFAELLVKKIEELETDTRGNEEFILPKEFDGKQLQWRYPVSNTTILLGILFLILLPIISYQKDGEIQKLSRKRNEQLQSSFSEFILRLVLLLEAGLNLQKAIYQIAWEYQKKSGYKKEYLYEEIWNICNQMKNGLPQKDAYMLLAKRCNLPCYKKMSGLFIQHIQKGGQGILEELRQEADKAVEEQKRFMQKKGEEMGTKLLFPMVIMLGVVMVFIMVPALFSFQI